ncbi:MAG: hypothetical protein ACREDZ_06740 [Kiloniellales bacterium]
MGPGLEDIKPAALDEGDENENGGRAGSLLSIQIRRRPQPRRPVATPARPAAAATTAIQAPTTAGQPAARRPVIHSAAEATDIQDYWMRLKRGRPAPSYQDLDIGQIERRWPGAMLLRYRPETAQVQIERKYATGSNGGDLSDDRGMTISAMLVQWLTTLAREAARRVRPVERRETFDSTSGTMAFKAIALPLTGESGRVERLLCHIERA